MVIHQGQEQQVKRNNLKLFITGALVLVVKFACTAAFLVIVVVEEIFRRALFDGASASRNPAST